MRLIDADDLINNLVSACNNDQSKIFPVWIEKQIDAQPTQESVQESVIEALKSDLDETLKVLGEQPEIVRCKDCKYFNNHPMEHGLHYGECDNGIGMVNCDWFCADGERKSNLT